jgi:hypothetical protein
MSAGSFSTIVKNTTTEPPCPGDWPRLLAENAQTIATVWIEWRRGPRQAPMTDGEPLSVRYQQIERVDGRRVDQFDTDDGIVGPTELAQALWSEGFDVYLRENAATDGALRQIEIQLNIGLSDGTIVEDSFKRIRPKPGAETSTDQRDVWIDDEPEEDRRDRRLTTEMRRERRQLFDFSIRLLDRLDQQSQQTAGFVSGLGSAFETAFSLQAGILESRKDEIMMLRQAEIDDARTDKLLDLGQKLFSEWMRRQGDASTRAPDGVDELVHLCREVNASIDEDAWTKILAMTPTEEAPDAWSDLRTVLELATQNDATRAALIASLEEVLPGIMTYDLADVAEAYPGVVALLPKLQRIKEVVFGG